MKTTFDEIETAYFFTSSNGGGYNEAYINIDTGKIYIISDYIDPEESIPEDIYESDKYIGLPNQHDLGLNNQVVFDFIYQYAPQHADEVHSIFRRKGAYRKYSFFLERIKLVDQWHTFQNTKIEDALRNWCKENNIELTD